MTAHPLWVHATGQVSGAGTGVPALAAALAEADWRPEVGLERPGGPPLAVATCAGFTTQGVLPPLVARRLDRPARLLAVAAREALAALGDPSPWPRERIGVSAATGNAGTEALVQVLRSVYLASPEEAPPMQFPSTVANAPASQLGILEKLPGPNVTFAEKQVGGLRALAEAARLIAHGRADAIVAAAVDEAQWLNAEAYDRLRALRGPGRPGFVLGEGAVALVVSGSPAAPPLARVAGVASASSACPTFRYPSDPGALLRACRGAFDNAGCRAEDIGLVVSLANGSPALAALERQAMLALFPGRKPAALSVSDRVGEGSFSSLLRVLAATLVTAGRVVPRWRAPEHLAGAGFASIESTPAIVLVPGLAAGGSAIAAVITGP